MLTGWKKNSPLRHCRYFIHTLTLSLCGDGCKTVLPLRYFSSEILVSPRVAGSISRIKLLERWNRVNMTYHNLPQLFRRLPWNYGGVKTNEGILSSISYFIKLTPSIRDPLSAFDLNARALSTTPVKHVRNHETLSSMIPMPYFTKSNTNFMSGQELASNAFVTLHFSPSRFNYSVSLVGVVNSR